MLDLPTMEFISSGIIGTGREKPVYHLQHKTPRSLHYKCVMWNTRQYVDRTVLLPWTPK